MIPGCVIKRNEKGETQLHIACINGNIENVEKLLEEGHSVHVRDYCGWTPLHEAANHGFVEIAEKLLKAGADVNDPGGTMCAAVTPLHDAAACGNFSMIYFLLENNANVNAITENGETVLNCLEDWKDREGELSFESQAEYDYAHDKLTKLITVSPQTRRKSLPRKRPRWNGILDGEEEEEENKRKEPRRSEKFSAGEDYKRTIASLKHRGGLITSSIKHSSVQKVMAPLLDSEQILVDDWLEEDMVVPLKKRNSCETQTNVKRNSTESSSNVYRNSSTDSSMTTKRKSSNDFQESESDSKRQRKLSTESEGSWNLDPDSCDSLDSNETKFSEFPKKAQKKRARQLSLLKNGFTRESSSRTPSPIFPNTNHPLQKIMPCEVLNFSVLIDCDTYNVAITFYNDRQNVIEDLIEEVKSKFETDTGCKAKLKITTWEGIELSMETTPSFFKRNEESVKLRGEIVDMYIPSIVDRYKSISKKYNTSKYVALICDFGTEYLYHK